MAKSRKKGLTLSYGFINTVVTQLQKTIEEKNIKSVPVDIKKFIDEGLGFLNKGEKTYSPERLFKLRALLLSFIALHNIEVHLELEEFIRQSGDSQKSYSNASAYFCDAIDKIYRLLDEYPYREFEDVKLYFIDEDAKDKFLQHKEILEQLITTATEKRSLKFNKIINLLNYENVAISYSVKFLRKYQYITKEESIEKYLPAHYEIVKKKINKDFRELFDTHSFDEMTKKVLEDKREAQLKTIDEEYKYLKQCIEDGVDIDIKILGYEHAPMYPEISFVESLSDSTYKKSAHLRSEVANVLWYEPIQLKNSNTIAHVLKNYNHAFGDVYYLEKQKK